MTAGVGEILGTFATAPRVDEALRLRPERAAGAPNEPLEALGAGGGA